MNEYDYLIIYPSNDVDGILSAWLLNKALTGRRGIDNFRIKILPFDSKGDNQEILNHAYKEVYLAIAELTEAVYDFWYGNDTKIYFYFNDDVGYEHSKKFHNLFCNYNDFEGFTVSAGIEGIYFIEDEEEEDEENDPCYPVVYLYQEFMRSGTRFIRFGKGLTKIINDCMNHQGIETLFYWLDSTVDLTPKQLLDKVEKYAR